ncbi:MAG TPA: response regulator, partial [Candidatus Deferrimicrobium sp.]
MKSPTVLIVDSNPRDLAKYSAVLTESRYTVLQAAECPEAVGILAKHRGKLVVLSDLRVGEACGLDFLDDTLRKYPFLTFTFLASEPPLDSVIEALKRGAYDFLRKPVAPDILLHSVARSVQKLSLTLETEKQEKEIRKLFERSREDLKDARTLSSFKGFMISMAAH